MVILTLATTTKRSSFWQHSPYVIASGFSYTTAAFWTSVFGGPSRSESESPQILDIFVNFVKYVQTSTLAICEATEASWYFNGTTLYIHVAHATEWTGAIIQYGKGRGFSDSNVVYIGQTQYLPLIQQTPGIERSEDIREYQRLKLLSTDIELTNHNGDLDDMKDQFIVGNSALLAYVPNDKVVEGFVNPSDVVPQAFYYVESLENGRGSVPVTLQDIRKLEKKVPTRVFDTVTYPYLQDSDDGKIVQLVYGYCRGVKCVPVTATQAGTTDATYRAGEYLTSISAIRVKIGDTWTSRTASSTNLSQGLFTIPNARASAGQTPYECQIDCVGIAVAHAPDIIVDLYDRFVGHQFDTQFYDVAAWTAAANQLPTCGLVISDVKDILDIVPLIQNGVHPGFRFDITYDGRKTLILDDRTRPIDWKVSSVEVVDIDALAVSEISDYLYGSVTVNYDKNHSSGTYRSVTNDDNEEYVKLNYQWSNSLVIDSILTSKTEAEAMALAKATEYKDTVKTIPANLFGERFFGVKIYDIMQIDTAMGRLETYTGGFSGREYYGILIGQVVSIAPNYAQKTNRIVLRLLDRSPSQESLTVLITEDGSWLQCEDGQLLIGG